MSNVENLNSSRHAACLKVMADCEKVLSLILKSETEASRIPETMAA